MYSNQISSAKFDKDNIIIEDVSLEKEIKDTILKLATKLQKTTYAKNSKKTKKKKGDHAQRIREKN